jgi:NAD(P)-dependent dehydrogenase (short-subunit alcohol dehydrogenase family)
MKTLVVGASAGLGRAVAERLAADGHALYLVASDARDIAALVSDLSIRFGVKVTGESLDLAKLDIAALRQRVHDNLGPIENLFYIAGVSTLDSGPIDDDLAVRLIEVNFSAAVRIVNAFLPDLKEGSGNLVGAGSVSSSRGRRTNSVYAAAKNGLDTYFAAMRHYLAGARCRVQFYRLGYIETRMTFGQRLMFPALKPDQGAKVIVDNLGRDLGAVYLPWWWWPITAIIRLLPWPIFKRLNI